MRVAAVASMETRGALNANNQAMGTVRDLSRSGIALETGQPPIPGQTVVLRIVLDDEIHEMRTRATRVDRRGDSHFFMVGLDWSDCTAAQMEFFDRVLGVLENEPLA